MNNIRSRMFTPLASKPTRGSVTVGLEPVLTALLVAILAPLAIKFISWLAEMLWNWATGRPDAAKVDEQSGGRNYLSAPISATTDLALTRKRAGIATIPGDVAPTDAESAKFFADTQKYFREHEGDLKKYIETLFTGSPEAEAEGALGVPVGEDSAAFSGSDDYEWADRP